MVKRREDPGIEIEAPVCVRVPLASGRCLAIPAEILAEDRVVIGAGSELSDGTHPLDRVQVSIELLGAPEWVERRDLCDEDGEPIAWKPYMVETEETDDCCVPPPDADHTHDCYHVQAHLDRLD